MSAQPAHPEKKAANGFLYTSHPAMIVPVVPVGASTTKYFEVGHLLRFSTSANYSSGYWQGAGESKVVQADLTDGSIVSGVAAMNFLGVCVGEEPLNRPALGDMKGHLPVYDRSINVNTIAGPMSRVAACISTAIVLVKFWDETTAAEAILTSADIWKPVYISQDSGTPTYVGKDGYATIQDGHDGTLVQIGTLWGLPLEGGNMGYVLFDPSLAR